MTSSFKPTGPTPDPSAGELSRALSAIESGQFETATRILQAVVDRGAGNGRTWRLLAFSQFKRGLLQLALASGRQSTLAAADDALAWNTLGLIHHALGAWREASNAFGTACRLCPASLSLWANWGKTLFEFEQFDDAIQVLQHALSLGEHAASRKRLAHALVVRGQLQAAERHYRDVLEFCPADGDAWFALASLGQHHLRETDVLALRRVATDPVTTDADRIGIHFALSRCAEKSGDFESALEFLVAANAAERSRIQWNAADFTRLVTDVLCAFERAPPFPPSQRGQGTIFIVGMPRTGSSLVEQLIGQHPGVILGGELPLLPRIINDESRRQGMPFPCWVEKFVEADWVRLGEEYLNAIAPHRGGASVFTDKRNGNWIYVGALIRMLPGARIIYTCRAAEDACFGCFRQRFTQDAQPFSYDLAECVAYWRDCERAMRFWQQHDSSAIRVQSHEALVSAYADEATSLSAFCGLLPADVPRSFENATITTASAAQLRTARDAATSWSALYGVHLEPLRIALRTPVPT